MCPWENQCFWHSRLQTTETDRRISSYSSQLSARRGLNSGNYSLQWESRFHMQTWTENASTLKYTPIFTWIFREAKFRSTRKFTYSRHSCQEVSQYGTDSAFGLAPLLPLLMKRASLQLAFNSCCVPFDPFSRCEDLIWWLVEKLPPTHRTFPPPSFSFIR